MRLKEFLAEANLTSEKLWDAFDTKTLTSLYNKDYTDNVKIIASEYVGFDRIRKCGNFLVLIDNTDDTNDAVDDYAVTIFQLELSESGFFIELPAPLYSGNSLDDATAVVKKRLAKK